MSNQIEVIQKLYAKVKTYTVPKEHKEGVEQLEISITPLSLEDMGSLNMKENMPLSELAKNAKIMFSKSLGIIEEEAAKISFEYMEDLLGAVMDANNFKDEDLKKTGIKKFMEKKREQIKAGEEDGKSNTKA